MDPLSNLIRRASQVSMDLGDEEVILKVYFSTRRVDGNAHILSHPGP